MLEAAIHEAGHGIAALVLNRQLPKGQQFRVISMSVAEVPGSNGNHTGLCVMTIPRGMPDYLNAVMHLAGPATMFAGRTVYFAASLRVQDIAVAAAAIGVENLPVAWRDACAIVSGERECIGLIADCLIRTPDHEIDGAALLNIWEAAPPTPLTIQWETAPCLDQPRLPLHRPCLARCSAPAHPSQDTNPITA